MPHSNSPFPPGKGGMPYGKKSKSLAKIWYGLTLHIHFLILNLQNKFFNFSKLCLVFWQKFQQIKRNSPHSPTSFANDTNSHHLFTHYILCFRCLPWQRMLRNSSESSRIRSICPHHSRMMQNLHHLFTHCILCFRCLTIGREPLKIPANQVKFTPFAHITHFTQTFIHI